MKILLISATTLLLLFYTNIGMGESGDSHGHGKKHESHDDHSDQNSGHDHKKSKAKKSKVKSKKGNGHEHDDHKNHKGHDEGENKNKHQHDESNLDSEGHSDHAEHGEETDGHEEHGDHAEHGEETDGHEEHGDHAGHGEEAGGHDDHGGGSGIGPGKAITEVEDDGNRFKLSNESEKFLKIKTSTPEVLSDGQLRISRSSLVTFQNNKGVYVKTGGWFEIRKIKVISSTENHVIVSATSIPSGSNIASKGLGFLRAAHLQASGQGGKGHAH